MDLMVTASVIAEDPAQALGAVEQLTRAMLALAIDGRHVSISIHPAGDDDETADTDGAEGTG